MRNNFIMVKDIRQKDNHHFSIDWNDGTISNYRLSDLQLSCPCAKCYNPANGDSLVKQSDVDKNVKAVRISSSGRYALRIEFTSGCSKGIYSYSYLKDFARKGL